MEDSQRHTEVLPQGERIYELFCRRLESGWLVDCNGKVAIDLGSGILAEVRRSALNFISISTSNPIEFVARLMAGCCLGVPIFLCNPQWGASEWARVEMLMAQVDGRHRNLIMIPTGGSSGGIGFAMHTWETLSASVWGFREFYQIDKVNSVCVLPLYHVSGFMQLMRSLLTDGQLLFADYHQVCNDASLVLDRIEINNYFISLVPTQLHKLLDLAPSWLAKFNTILLGGAPPSLELLDRSRIAHLPLALTYGMTETASQITSLKSTEFLAGNNSCGRVLPHAQIELISAGDPGIGAIQITAKSLMLGYFPDLHPITDLETDDLGSIDDRGYLTILGRNSGKIITGGENVLPIEVVNAIMSTGLVSDVWVVGLPDPYWGQIVTALYVAAESISSNQLIMAVSAKIANYKIPKYWFNTTYIPRNHLGKILIDEVEVLAQTRMETSQISIDRNR